MSLKLYVVSMNRACQLHALIESLEKNASGLFDYHISYKVSNNLYRLGYDKLINSLLGKKCSWREQTAYGEHWYEFLTSNQSDLVTHIVDDCIWYRKTDITESDVTTILDENYGWDFWGFNWRVGLETIINNHRERKPYHYPKSLYHSDLVCNWNYTEYSDMWSSYWAFPYSLDGMTYRVNDLLEYLEHVNIREFTDPAQMEHHLCRSPRRNKIERPWMASPLYSCCFSNHINATHTRGYDPAGMFMMSTSKLNELYLDGFKISLDSMDFSRIQCGHEQIGFDLVKE